MIFHKHNVLNVIYLIITFIAIIGFICSISYYFSFNNYFQTECLIKNITYPETLDSESNDLWQSCRGGDNCYIYRPSVRLYTTDYYSNELNSNFIKLNVNDNIIHVFYVKRCRN